MSIKSERLLSRAKKLLVKGKITEAESIYLDILSSSPKNKEAKDALLMINNRKQETLPMDNIQSAVSFLNSGRIKEAVDVIEPLIKNFHKNILCDFFSILPVLTILQCEIEYQVFILVIDILKCHRLFLLPPTVSI